MDTLNISLHGAKEKEVFEFFNQIVKETTIVFLKDVSGGDRIPLRIQMIITFSLIDILASYWFEYLEKTGTQQERFCLWYKTFCKTYRNKKYLKNQQWNILSSSRLYQLRNSLVHFFGLSSKIENIYLSLVPNDLPDNEKSDLEKRLNNHKYKTIVIKPNEFHELVREGGILMLEDWLENVRLANSGDTNKKNAHIKGINKIWEKIRSEGASIILKKK